MIAQSTRAEFPINVFLHIAFHTARQLLFKQFLQQDKTQVAVFITIGFTVFCGQYLLVDGIAIPFSDV